jgi:hypothetical protein
MISRRRIIYGILLLPLLILGLSAGCSKDPSGWYSIEIAPTNFVPVKFSSMFPTHLKINYQGQLVSYIDPPGLNRPRSLMDFAPSAFEAGFLSGAHGPAEISHTIDAARDAFRESRA